MVLVKLRREREGFDADAVLRPPDTQRQKCLDESHPERGHGIVDFRRHLPVIVTDQHTDVHQIAQLLDQHFLADADDQTLQVPEAPGTSLEMEEDQRLPLPAHHGQCDIKTAGGLIRSHQLTHAYLLVGTTIPARAGPYRVRRRTEAKMGKLDGKVAVITGANSGIGLASAKRFAQEGAQVFMTGRRQAELDVAVAEVGGDARGVRGDVANLADLDRLYGIVGEEAGRIDVLLANAGGGEFVPLPEITEEHYERTFGTNVKGTLFTVQKALPLLRDGASVILTGSTTGVTGGPSFSVYSASKAAIRNFARSWIQDLALRRIRVNVLVPGATSTPGLHGLTHTAEQNRAFVAAMEAAAPLGRMGDPDEIAAAALFLASDDSSFVTGSELFVDGGSAQI